MQSDPPVILGDFRVAVVVTSPPWYENCYLIQHQPSGELAIVDPGDDADRIIAQVRALGGTPKEILLTHGHPDHLGAARAVQAEFAVPCRVHAEERPVVEHAPALARMFTGEALELPEDLRYFAGEPAMDLGGAAFRVLHSPGHTPGGVCYVFDGFVVTGDTLFNQGVGRTDLPGGSQDALWDSITRLLAEVPEDARVFSGHGPGWTVGAARRWWRRMA